ncbi:MAG: trypsin-like peptidase domain-containing protein [Candidatus Yonathbacteria bacterium]|nr:trypsin-like peptidase domain-containing protein [Candidatus Yonathbacteria bacterium]
MFGELIYTLHIIGTLFVGIVMQLSVLLGILPQDTLLPAQEPATTAHNQDIVSPEHALQPLNNAKDGTITSPKSVPKETLSTTPSTSTEKSNAVSTKQHTTTDIPAISSSEVDAEAHAAMVNILCITKEQSVIQPISGSGMLIDPRGIIITNAHIAQYFLLEKYRNGSLIDCRIRTGGPAHDTYDAEPIFISSSWMTKNAHTIIEETPTGTGENDIALLLVTRSIDNLPLPVAFPFMNYSTNEEETSAGTPVLVASYPAELIDGASVLKDLWPVTATTNIIEMFTFTTDTPDVFSLKGSIASQHGSSGGGAIDLTTGKLIGIVVTTTEGTTAVDRELNAITFQHISTAIRRDIGIPLSTFLAKDPRESLTTFNQNTAPRLLSMLLGVLNW